MIKKTGANEKVMYVLDTNVYSSLFNLALSSSRKLRSSIEKIENNIVVPNTVYEEYKAFNPRKENGKYSKFSKDLIKRFDEQKRDFMKDMKKIKQIGFNNVDLFENEIIDVYDKLNEVLKEYNVSLSSETEIVRDYIEKTIEFTDGILEKKLSKPDNIELIDWLKEGEIRLKYGIPPGNMDDTKPKSIHQLGDFLIWKEIIKYADNNENVKEIIYVTNDIKEWIDGKADISLVNEFSELTNTKIEFKKLENFMYELSGDKKIPVEIIGFELSFSKIIKEIELLLSKYYEQINVHFNQSKQINVLFKEEIMSQLDSDLKNFMQWSELRIDLSSIEVVNTNFLINDEEANAEYSFEILCGFECFLTYMDYESLIQHDYNIFINSEKEIKIVRNIDISDSEFKTIFVKSITEKDKDIKMKITDFYWSGNFDIEDYPEFNSDGDSLGTECPQCGEELTMENDAVNGFCINCTRKLDL